MQNTESELSNINVQDLGFNSNMESTSPLLQIPNRRLPSYIKPLHCSMDGEDVDYLWRTGAFSIPEDPLLNELLRSYTTFVHPSLPVVDLNDFLRMINHNEGEPISLILIQVIMFTASAFVDASYLYAAGFPSRKAAQKALYRRAKVCNQPSSSEIATT